MTDFITRPSGIMVPARFNGSWADGLMLDNDQKKRVIFGCIKVVRDSFDDDPKLTGAVREGSVAESVIKERFKICEKWVRTLRGELHWPLRKILDMLPRALRAELDGETFVPTDRHGWRPNAEVR